MLSNEDSYPLNIELSMTDVSITAMQTKWTWNLTPQSQSLLHSCSLAEMLEHKMILIGCLTKTHIALICCWVLLAPTDYQSIRQSVKSTTLKSMVQVGDPSHLMCGKIMWELDFHNSMFIYTLQWLLGLFFVLVLLFCNLGAKAVT